jgi:hypothetical protein
MPRDISHVPLQELYDDREDSLADIVLCERALAMGISVHGAGYSTQERLDTNRAIVDMIDVELKRRGEPTVRIVSQ